MRKTVIGFVLGCGLAAAAMAPALACAMHDQAAASRDQQKTAQAQPSSQTSTR